MPDLADLFYANKGSTSMYRAVALTILSVLLATAGSANEVVLKSGARGWLAVSVSEAPALFGGPDAGNMIDLNLTVTSERRVKPEQDASSLCHLYGKSSYRRMRSDPAFLDVANAFIDMSAPLVGVRVSFFNREAGPISIGRNLHFDMRGLVTCRLSS